MKIKSIEILNYRKIKKAKLNMEDNITVLAGANNSGKTSLVELFDSVFAKPKGKLCLNKTDFPVELCEEWGKRSFPIFRDAFSYPKKEDAQTHIREKIFGDTPVTISPIMLKIQIDYDKEADDIRNFADYIMELSPDNTSFYFMYKYELNNKLFFDNFDKYYEKMKPRFQKISDSGVTGNKAERVICEMLIDWYDDSCTEEAYFCDSLYDNSVHMDVSEFKALFNFGHITANRALDDERADKSRILSKNVVDIASQADDWKAMTQDLPDKIIQPIQDAGIQDKVRQISLDPLKGTMDAIAQTNGGAAGNIIIDMEITEDSIKSLLKGITSAKYQMGDYYLNESSQGLGYSNLIYIHLQLEKYKKTINRLVVNFFVIEEPEAHMHPQMQNAFAQYLFNYYKDKSEMQGMLTTHSHEVVRNAKIPQLRVLRQTATFTCELYDLRIFYETVQKSEPELLEFYNFFYTINFPDLIFADKIIMYEGDTERMLIKSILCSGEFKTLGDQYISFVQVGGAYAHRYFPIVNYLGIKTIILTDLDYKADDKTSKAVLSSTTTNSAIKFFYKKSHPQDSSAENPSIEEIYDWETVSALRVFGDKSNVYLGFQGKKDNLSRTLEEAMLSKFYGVSAIEAKPKDEWKSKKEKSGLDFSFPRSNDSPSIRDIVLSTSNRKTDFMYSVIMKKLQMEMLPDYIREALEWLAR